MSPLRALIDAGLTLRADGARLIVTPASALTDSLRELIRQNKAELLALQVGATGRSTSAVISVKAATTSTPAGGDTGGAPVVVDVDRWCWPHSDAMSAAELQALALRTERFIRLCIGGGEATLLAGRLVTRDRDGDDRRLCLECSSLGDGGRCIAAANGRLAGADRRLEPVTTMLQRCPAFGLRKGLV